MKNVLLIALAIINFGISNGQATKPTNVYPSNLEENQYFESYDATKQTIKGIHFAVLSDGDNSLDRTPAFNVKLYLYQNGKDPIFIKTYELERGTKHLTRKDFSNENVSIKDLNIQPGEYRLGVYVNADKSFEEDFNDNAILFRDPIQISKSSVNQTGGIQNIPLKKKDKDEDHDEEDEADDDDDFFDDDFDDDEDEDDDDF